MIYAIWVLAIVSVIAFPVIPYAAHQLLKHGPFNVNLRFRLYGLFARMSFIITLPLTVLLLCLQKGLQWSLSAGVAILSIGLSILLVSIACEIVAQYHMRRRQRLLDERMHALRKEREEGKPVPPNFRPPRVRARTHKPRTAYPRDDPDKKK